MNNFDTIKIDLQGQICTVTINRPDKLNALNRQVIDELHTAFDQIADNNEIRVVILTGSGDKAFVAGADIKEINTLTPVMARDFARHGQNLMSKIEQLGKPVIAAINGYALGGGCELAMACTLRMASDNARMGLPEIGLGIMPGFGGTQRITRLVGRTAALELTLTGRQLKADDMLKLGLVNRIVDASELTEQVHELASKLSQSAPLAMRNIIQAINLAADTSLDSGLNYEAQLFGLCCATEDMREGTQAFLEKRKATFKGH